MATTSFTIYSHYDPDKDKERLQRDSGQVLDPDATKEPDNDTLWREAASAPFLRAQRPPPKFVPATISYGFDSDTGPSTLKQTTPSPSLGTSLSSWYRSLAIANDSGPSSYQPRASSAPVSTSSSVGESKESASGSPRRTQTKNKNNWFIQKVLQSAPPSAPSTPPPTLTDILARDPPPLPSEPRYHPPVWLEIGPSNRGFTMLQKGGWNEGEALGVGGGKGSRRSHAQSSSTSIPSTRARKSYIDKGKYKNQDTEMMKFETENQRQDGQGPSDVRQEKLCNDVIDLTLSDAESEEDDDFVVKKEEFAEARGEGISLAGTEGPDNSHGGTALLTPIATALKLDRLGIGLKAKTEGPYKASVKRVTHHAAALAAHMKAAQEARKRREKFGRGHRGYERQKRGEEERRQRLLAYMNS